MSIKLTEKPTATMEFRQSVRARLARRMFVDVFNSSVVNMEMMITILPKQARRNIFFIRVHHVLWQIQWPLLIKVKAKCVQTL